MLADAPSPHSSTPNTVTAQMGSVCSTMLGEATELPGRGGAPQYAGSMGVGNVGLWESPQQVVRPKSCLGSGSRWGGRGRPCGRWPW